MESIVSSYDDAEIKTFNFHSGFPILANDRRCHMHASQALHSCEFITKKAQLLYGGEDFAFYAQHCPSSFWMLGAKQGPGYDHHTALFNPDESVLWQGVAFWLSLV